MEETVNMIQKKIFQKIFDEVNKCLPAKWERVVIYLEYGEDAYSYAFYIRTSGKYVNGFDLPNASEKNITDSFENIDKIIQKERSAIKDKPWTNMTMIVNGDGMMHTDFDYTDLAEGAYKYKKAWKKKYLNK